MVQKKAVKKPAQKKPATKRVVTKRPVGESAPTKTQSINPLIPPKGHPAKVKGVEAPPPVEPPKSKKGRKPIFPLDAKIEYLKDLPKDDTLENKAEYAKILGIKPWTQQCAAFRAVTDKKHKTYGDAREATANLNRYSNTCAFWDALKGYVEVVV